MSNALAIATVTEALRGFLAANLLPEINFAVDVTARKPFVDPLSDFVVVTRNDNGINDGHAFLYVE